MKRKRSVFWPEAVAYPDGLGDWYTGLGAQTLVPKKILFRFYFFSCISTENMLK